MTAAPFTLVDDAAVCVSCGKNTIAREPGTGRPLHILCAPPPLPAQRAPRAALTQDQEQLAGQLQNFVTGLLDAHEGDVEAVAAALDKKPIPLVMELFLATRTQGRYNVLRKPASPDIFRKPGPKMPDQIWEARPKWRRADIEQHPERELLDVNAAYLAALKCHLPYGELQHRPGPAFYGGTAGVHLVTPPTWEHDDLPNPMGDRDTPGPVWITTATLRLLLRCAAAKLCGEPEIHEQWIAPSSEGLLESMRVILDHVRVDAIERGDDLTKGLVAGMYAKFVSTCGESRANHLIRRPDWEHNLRAQAFANLWGRAYKAHQAGLTVLRIGGTDELELVGDWRTLWPEGRGLAQIKIKKEVQQ